MLAPHDRLGWFASGLVFATFCAREMLPLRILALASNVAFISYGYSGHLWPIGGLTCGDGTDELVAPSTGASGVKR